MLKVVNTKILLAILAAVVAVGGYMVHEHEVNERAAATAAQAALLLQQQHDAAEAIRKHDEQLRAEVEQQRKKSRAMPVNGSKVWTHYLP